jgi:hypothetical protein
MEATASLTLEPTDMTFVNTLHCKERQDAIEYAPTSLSVSCPRSIQAAIPVRRPTAPDKHTAGELIREPLPAAQAYTFVHRVPKVHLTLVLFAMAVAANPHNRRCANHAGPCSSTNMCCDRFVCADSTCY